MSSIEKWNSDAHASHYAKKRWKSTRAAGRDPAITAKLLERHGVQGPVLDVPCGTGRLTSTLREHATAVYGADVSREMLEHATGPRVAASADRLPFRDAAFDVVVSCRLLHHVHDSDRRTQILSELCRVSSRLVIGSFWDAASWHAFRRRVGLRRDEGPRGRRAVERSQLVRELRTAELEPIEFRYSFRFISQQAFFVARKA